MSEANDPGLRDLLSALERKISDDTRRLARQDLWRAAMHYRRSRSMLMDLLPQDLLSLALTDQRNPALTWCVLRHLCRHIRSNRRSALGSTLRLRRCRMAAAGEIQILTQQRIAARDRALVGDIFSGIRQAAR